MKNWQVDTSWTLFLDRDGVINTRKIGGYIEQVEEFIFLPDVLNALKEASDLFDTIVVVTNQQGIGKGLMTQEQLVLIHNHMQAQVEKAGGRIDKCYFAPQLAKEQSELRKPKGGMALLAKSDFPNIDFRKSIMVGDSDSDIEFGINLGMKTVRVGGVNEHPKADVHVDSLAKFMEQL